MNKYKWEVIEEMSWRNKDFKPGQIIEDTDNTYMRAMVHQGKIKRVD